MEKHIERERETHKLVRGGKHTIFGTDRQRFKKKCTIFQFVLPPCPGSVFREYLGKPSYSTCKQRRSEAKPYILFCSVLDEWGVGGNSDGEQSS